MKIFSIIFFIVLLVPIFSAFAEEMNVGKTYWDREIISPNSFAKIIVEDDDMNKKEYPNFADKFTIVVWSDSSPDRIEIELVETGVYSGIFTGKIFVSDSQNEGKKLFASPGDFIYAMYLDTTTPQLNTSSEIIAAAVVKISGEDMSKRLNELDSSMRSNPQSLIPSWIKSNAGWWADGTITDGEFLSGIQFLIEDEIMTVPQTNVSSETSEIVPSWD